MDTILNAAVRRGAILLMALSLGGCAVYDTTPAYYAGDAPIYVQPGPYYVAPPVYVPPPVYFNFGYRRGWGHYYGYPRYGWHGGYPRGPGRRWHR